MFTKYKCRVESFNDICTFYTWLNEINFNKSLNIKFYNIFIKQVNNGNELIFEFESNIDDYMFIKKLIFDCNKNFYFMYKTLLPIDKYTGIIN